MSITFDLKNTESITFDLKNTEATWFPKKKDQTIRIPFQKGVKQSDKIEIGKVLAILARDDKDDKFGQPYLPNFKLIGEVIKHGQNPKIHGMKYKAKKRTKKTWGHREQYTLIKIVAVENK